MDIFIKYMDIYAVDKQSIKMVKLKKGDENMQRILTEKSDSTNFSSNKFLSINSCEKSRLSNRPYTVLRTKGRVDFQIIYVSSGILKVNFDGDTINAEKGSVIIYKPGEKQCYTFDTPGTETYWVHFSGIGAEEILKRANLWIKSLYTVSENNIIGALFDEMIKEKTLKNYQCDMLCEAKLTEIIAQISRLATSDTGSENPSQRLIYSVIEKMRTDCALPFSLDNLAKTCNLSRSRFEHLFKEVTGLSPYAYLTKIRLGKARYLLSNTSLNVSEISNMTGFSDPLYFSRLFAKKFSVPPTVYRKNN